MARPKRALGELGKVTYTVEPTAWSSRERESMTATGKSVVPAAAERQRLRL